MFLILCVYQKHTSFILYMVKHNASRLSRSLVQLIANIHRSNDIRKKLHFLKQTLSLCLILLGPFMHASKVPLVCYKPIHGYHQCATYAHNILTLTCIHKEHMQRIGFCCSRCFCCCCRCCCCCSCANPWYEFRMSVFSCV